MPLEGRKRICIGIPCFQGVSAETLEDYLRFAYYCGRRYQEFDFYLGIKSKSEQFRARNAIVEAALQAGADYLLMLDDDHVIDWEGTQGPSTAYEWLRTLVGHLEADPKRAICGALYYQRGGDCKPVLMKEGPDGGYYWLKDSEITGGLQRVDVTGGGAMVVNTNLFSRVKGPWFEPELDLGTDIQICRKATQAGMEVWCDTSLVLGHVKSERMVITPHNRHKEIAKTEQGMDRAWQTQSALRLYCDDACEYTGKTLEDFTWMGPDYNRIFLARFAALREQGLTQEKATEHYRTLDAHQIARQVWYHTQPAIVQQAETWWRLFDPTKRLRGLDFGCGTAPIGFELVLRGHTLDFVDVEGAPAYEFVRWRARRRGVEKRCGWRIGENGPYQFVFLLDALEHLVDWQGPLEEILACLEPGGVLLTNYFVLDDWENPEHVSMDREAVRAFLLERDIYPQTNAVWTKQRLIKESAA